MAKVITVVNQKGGVGKSTVSQFTGNELSARGYEVLFIDLDPQGNLSYSLGINILELENNQTIYEPLTNGTDAGKVILTTEQADVIPASQLLASLDIVTYALNNALEPLKNAYDVIVIDTPPTLSTLVINALTASDTLVIPALADAYSLQGLGQLRNTIEAVQEATNPSLTIAGILLTKYDKRKVLTRTIHKMLKDTASSLNTKVFNAKIRDAIAVTEAQSMQQDLLQYDPHANVVRDIKAYVTELENNQTIYEPRTNGTDASKVILTTEQADVIPASQFLASLDIGNYALNNALEPLKSAYDVIVIDTPPTLSTLVINALTASDALVIPALADAYSLQGLGQLRNTIEAVQDALNPNLTIAGILLTKYDKRKVLTRTIHKMLKDTASSLNTKVFNAKIRDAVAITEAQAMQQDILKYDPHANVVRDIKAYVTELEKEW